MRIAAAFALVCLALHGQGVCGETAALTAQEQRWVEAVWPVVEQAQRAGLPVDIVVQPQPAPGAAPMATAYIGRRCKLVFSLRENPLAPEQERRIEQGLGPGRAAGAAALELMAAHELFGHCVRHVAEQWRAAPHGYADPVPADLATALHADYRAMRAQRREEGYADLAALAWARAQRAADYARLRDWLVRERGHDLVPGSSHDTLAWLQHARAGLRAAAEVWREVLLDESDMQPVGTVTATASSAGP